MDRAKKAAVSAKGSFLELLPLPLRLRSTNNILILLLFLYTLRIILLFDINTITTELLTYCFKLLPVLLGAMMMHSNHVNSSPLASKWPKSLITVIGSLRPKALKKYDSFEGKGHELFRSRDSHVPAFLWDPRSSLDRRAATAHIGTAVEASQRSART